MLLKQAVEKRCYARWMQHAGLALEGRPQPDAAPTWDDCGPDATRIASAVAASLARAVKAGMNDDGRQRAAEFARQHHLPVVDTQGG